jgi:hypothetical protein
VYYYHSELAKDALHKTGLFSVIEGIISPVNDDYRKLTTKVFDNAPWSSNSK